jgi:maltose O-acetyltransferase
MKKLVNFLKKLSLNLKGSSVDYSSTLWKNVIIHGNKLRLGSNSGIGDNVVIWANDEVVIGNNVLIAANTVITSAGHPLNKKYRSKIIKEPVIIEDFCWIGANCTILPGVRLKKNTIVAAGSVVHKSINESLEENILIGGIPAQIIKRNVD